MKHHPLLLNIDAGFGIHRERYSEGLQEGGLDLAYVAETGAELAVDGGPANTGSSETLEDPRRQRVCFVGHFGGSTETGLSYPALHKVRPPSAKADDSSWLVLWLVRNLQSIEPPRRYREFLSAKTGKPLAKEPQGPMLIRAAAGGGAA